MFKIIVTLTNGREMSYKVSEEEEALETYFDIQKAMTAVINERDHEVLALGDSLLIRPDAIIGCELKGPRTE
ncbi:hypothetical protein SAMN05421781_0804 [Marinococcus luteus]|uniref:Uncharacterized protein n=1 Tax=Marinococcus luteus TaxID=1122204 RepID=A0A1H2RJC9_9BACI|nr:hypothetical protein [Marinococcus luteus]SDW19582.1 hypothetical protein SAMN05421781_0804 [Marinococcus luteus]